MRQQKLTLDYANLVTLPLTQHVHRASVNK